MGFRLTLILVAVIYVVLRFGGGGVPDQPVASAPQTEAAPSESSEASSNDVAATPDQPTAEPAPETPEIAENASPQAPASDLSASAIEDAVAEALSVEPGATDQTADEDGPTTLPGLSLGNLQINDNNAAALSLADSVRQRSEANQADPLAPIDRNPQAEAVQILQETATQSNLSQTGLLGESNSTLPVSLPKARVTATSVNLRAGPSTAEAVVGRVSQGEIVEVIGSDFPGWTGIRHPERGDTVYVASQFLQDIDN